MPRRLLLLLGACCLLFAASGALSGCSHYRLGTGADLKFKSLYVAPVSSETLAPQSRAIISSKIRECFLRDGRITLVNSAEEADATLQVTLKQYGREATVSKASDAGLARKFALTLNAECSLTTHDGKTLFSARKLQAQREVYVDGGQLQAEFETLPFLADQMAREVTHATLDTW